MKKLIATQKIEDKVLFTDLLMGKEKLSAYVDGDIFVLTSYSEGLPLAVLEACASGKPVVITDRCNVPEVTEYRAGFVVQADKEELKQALLQLLNDSKLTRVCSRNARRMIKEKFTWNKVARRIERVYSEVLDIGT